ncbi:MAG: hypothetical protein WAW61_13060 [Methylococcaceae bacterium]
MNMINQGSTAIKFLNTHPGSHMNLTPENPELSRFIKRLTNLQNGLKAALDKSSTEKFISIDYELSQLKQDYQKLAGSDGNQSPLLVQSGQLLGQCEAMFSKINTLQCL